MPSSKYCFWLQCGAFFAPRAPSAKMSVCIIEAILLISYTICSFLCAFPASNTFFYKTSFYFWKKCSPPSVGSMTLTAAKGASSCNTCLRSPAFKQISTISGLLFAVHVVMMSSSCSRRLRTACFLTPACNSLPSIYRKSIEHLSKINRNPWNIFSLKPIVFIWIRAHLCYIKPEGRKSSALYQNPRSTHFQVFLDITQIHPKSIEHRLDIYRRSIEDLSKVYRRSIEDLSNICRTSIEQV